MSTPDRPEAGPDTSQPPQQDRVIERRAPRWMKLGLVASLALNLVIVGLGLGLMLRGGPGEGPPRVWRDGAVPLSQALAPEDRRAIAREVRRDLRARDGGVPREESFDAMLAQLRADAFDEAAFARHLEVQAERGFARIRVSQAALIRHLAAQSPEARRAYADRVEEALQKKAGRRDAP